MPWRTLAPAARKMQSTNIIRYAKLCQYYARSPQCMGTSTVCVCFVHHTPPSSWPGRWPPLHRPRGLHLSLRVLAVAMVTACAQHYCNLPTTPPSLSDVVRRTGGRRWPDRDTTTGDDEHRRRQRRECVRSVCNYVGRMQRRTAHSCRNSGSRTRARDQVRVVPVPIVHIWRGGGGWWVMGVRLWVGS